MMSVRNTVEIAKGHRLGTGSLENRRHREVRTGSSTIVAHDQNLCRG